MVNVRDVTLLLLPGNINYTHIHSGILMGGGSVVEAAAVCPFSHKCRVVRQSLSGNSSPWQRAEDAHDGSYQKCVFVFRPMPFHSNGEVIAEKLDQRSPFLRSL